MGSLWYYNIEGVRESFSDYCQALIEGFIYLFIFAHVDESIFSDVSINFVTNGSHDKVD